MEPVNIASILVTHIHPDHIYGLPSLVHSLMFEEKSINLFGARETIDFCQRFLDLFSLREERFQCRINFEILEEDVSFPLSSSISCKAIDVPHHPSSLAFRLQFKDSGKALLYSGDTPIHPPLFEEAQDIDYLIHECSAPLRYFEKHPVLYDIHTNSYDLGRYCQKSRVKSLFPCHIFGDLEFSEEEIEQELLENYDANLIIPHDLMRVEV